MVVFAGYIFRTWFNHAASVIQLMILGSMQFRLSSWTIAFAQNFCTIVLAFGSQHPGVGCDPFISIISSEKKK